MSDPRGTRQQRDYGPEHQRERQRWTPQVARGVVPCARCGELIPGGVVTNRAWRESWHLDHTDDRRAYLGPSHRSCNIAAGNDARHAVSPGVRSGAGLTPAVDPPAQLGDEWT